MPARPTDYVLKVYPSKVLAVAEGGSALQALSVVGDEVTATAVVVDFSEELFTFTGASPAINTMFSVGELVTITGCAVATNNISGAQITAVTANTFTVNFPAPSVDETTTATITLKQATSVRPQIDNTNQSGNFTDEDGITQQVNFFTHERMFYRLDAVTPCKEFYIDWDDGEDNTKNKANYSLKKFDLPQNYAIFEHTYTKHGHFYPLIRCMNAAGFKSKFYTVANAPRSSYRELEPNFDLTADQVTGSPEQDQSVVSLDSATQSRIPSFIPSNYPPTGVLKSDRMVVFAGIDNTVFSEALTGANTALGPLARGYVYIDGVDIGVRHASGVSGGVYIIENLVEVTYINSNYEVKKEILPGTTGTLANQHVGSVFPSDGAGLREIISVKLRTVKENKYGDAGLAGKYNVKTDGLYPDERVWIRLVDNSDTLTPFYSFGSLNPTDMKTVGKAYPCFGCVSNGNPYISINEPRYSISVDGSESIARNSNVTIAKYWLYDDKLRTRDKAGTDGVSGAKETIWDNAAPDIQQITNTFGVQVESSINPKQTLTYAFDYMRGNQTNEDEFYGIKYDNSQLKGIGRFYDEHRLLRLQVEDSSIDGPNATLIEDVDGSGERGADTMDRSFIENDGNFSVELSSRPASTKNIGVTLFRNETNKTWVDLAARNPETLKVNFGGDGTTLGSSFRINLSDTTDINSGAPKNFLLLAKDRKFGKVFFRQDNDNIIRQLYQGSKPLTKLVAWYSGPTNWKALAIKDETSLPYTVTDGTGNATSLYRSGTVSFDIPEDWTPIQASNTNPTATDYNGGWNIPISGSHEESNNTLTVTGTYTITGTNNYVLSVGEPQNQFIVGDRILVSGATVAGNNGIKTITAVASRSITVSGTLTNTSSPQTAITFTIPTSYSTAPYVEEVGTVVPIHVTPEQAMNSAKTPQSHGEAGVYSIVIGIKSVGTTGIQNLHVTTCDNQHSRVIKIVDPKHISINEAMVAQSIGFRRRGKYYEITDRLGKSEIRRMGAGGGKLSLGGVELGNNVAAVGTRTRERIVHYQKEGTPIYYDVRHRNGTYTRFFGVIDSLAEDIPAGKAMPKFAISLIVAHIIEYDTNGIFTENVISLGGKVDAVKSYHAS